MTDLPALDMSGFRVGEIVDLLDWAHEHPGYLSDPLVACLQEVRDNPPPPCTVRIVSVTRGEPPNCERVVSEHPPRNRHERRAAAAKRR